MTSPGTIAQLHAVTSPGTIAPRRLILWGALGSARTKRISGFDLRGFNAFRNSESVGDMEQIYLNEPGFGALLSAPIRLLDIDLNNPPPAGLSGPFNLSANACADGILNCLVTWFELEMPSGERVSFAPSETNPQHMYFRAVRQQIEMLNYERQLGVRLEGPLRN